MSAGENLLPAEVAELERRLAAAPEDLAVRHDLATALATMADQARSLTRDEHRVITTERQRRLCAYAADRILALDAGERLTAFARDLRAELDAGGGWTWARPATAGVLAGVSVAAGLAVVTVGALSGSVVAVVLAGVLSSLALAAVVLRYRREQWRVRAEQALPLVWQHGV